MDQRLNTNDVAAILRIWEEENQTPGYDPVPILTRLAEIIEAETENYMKMDPDPFDERHPSRTDPDCELGHILKVLFRKDSFVTKLVNDYLRENYWSRSGSHSKDSRKVNIAACRLMLDIMPGLEISAVFQVPEMESLILRVFSWAEKSVQPLQSYATGLLAAAMEVQDIAANFREQNAKLVPLKLQELHRLQSSAAEEAQTQCSLPSARPFAHLGQANGCVGRTSPLRSPTAPSLYNDSSDCTELLVNGVDRSPPRKKPRKDLDEDCQLFDSYVMSPPPSVQSKVTSVVPATHMNGAPVSSECSNSSWAEMESYVIGNIQMYPPTTATRQMLILRYLTPMGEYQEFLSHVFEHNALELILRYTNLRESKDSRLAFEALKYLAALLCHKKFSIEFINMKGLSTLLSVPRPSVAATGVSICLYYLAYCEDAMERVCQLPHNIISDLVRYALWLLECSHASGRCHATMFFGLSFQFRAILHEFDAQDGLRKLYNTVSTQQILTADYSGALNDDEESAARQVVRHVCVALKRYAEAHLCIRARQLRRSQLRETSGQHLEPAPHPVKVKSTPEEVLEHMQTLLELMPFTSHWEPVDQFVRHGGITLLLQIVAHTYKWNYSGRAETTRSALDVLAICSVMPQVQVQLCERVELPDGTVTVGMNIVLGAAEGEIVADCDVRRSALAIVANCVCPPIMRVGGNMGRFSIMGLSKKKNLRTSEELITKMWECVRTNNGIMVLLQQIMLKTPITDADSLRAMACRALAGLARSETVQQIISKLPLFTNGQLQLMMRDPILQDRRLEHVMFQKYAMELLERVSGKPKPTGNELEISLYNMHRASVVAQTRIQYNSKQLNQLIHQHLLSQGLTESAASLQREASLPSLPTKQGNSTFFPPYSHRPRLSVGSPAVEHHPPSLHRSPAAHLSGTVSSSPPVAQRLATPSGSLAAGSTTPHHLPIRLSLSSSKRAIQSTSSMFSACSRSLQKQISWENSFPSPLGKTTLTSSGDSHITLDSIITEYLTNQHALCKNPVVPCPQFNLFEPHRCPDPKAKNSSPTNFVMRTCRRELGLSGRDAVRLDHRLVHSRFCPVKTFRSTSEDGGFFTCCDFLPFEHCVMVGSYTGEVKTYNLSTGAEDASYHCHDSAITHIMCSRDQSLLLTSSLWRRPLSALWSIKYFELKFPMDEEEYVEFSKVTQDRIISTKAEVATIYDVGTASKIMTLIPSISNQYQKNRATFSPSDDLVLSDGILWDVASGKQVHKFDKLNQTLNGIFHPNGLEVVANTEVWDLRTFHLLRTVPALDQCQVVFTPQGDTLYTIMMEHESEEEEGYETSFKTLDAYDYSSIATIDVKKSVYDLSCNKYDTQIAVVENQGLIDDIQESMVRIYDVGRRRDDEDEGEEEEDDDEEGSEGSASASDDDQQDDAREAGDDDANRNNSADQASDANASDSDSEGSEVIISLSDVSLDNDSFNMYDV
ncbi:protein mahjong isoform X2 [Bacillus rossius redtenbacheri]|uniref:protein mahjong isoform X2 n=1 Tax=Bacillus rossius redtenbacheri TaxID=93214 RepID=UPI002FDDA935